MSPRLDRYLALAALALAASVVAGLLVACGGGEISPGEAATESTSTESPTSTASTAVSSTSISVTSSRPATTTTTAVPPSDTTPLDVAQSWLAAYQLGDVEAFQELTHPEATALCVQCGYDRQEEPYFAQIGEATADVSDSRMLALANGSIDPTCNADGAVVTCQTLRTSDFGFFSDGGEPKEQMEATYEFTVEDGLVTRRVVTIHFGRPFDWAAVASYEKWLRDHDPAAYGELFAFGTILLTTAEQFERHGEYVRGYWDDR